MSPRGKVKLLIEAMEAQPEKEQWLPTECAEIVGPAVNQSLAAAVKRGWLHKHDLGGRRVAYSLQPAANDDQAEDPQEFQAAAWADGDVDLYGLVPLEDGGHRLTPEMVAKLKRLIAWMPAQ